MAAAVLIPVKAFDVAKGRLAAVLTPQERAHLAREMAALVVAAAAPLPVVVVCDHPDVRGWAESVGAEPIWTPGLGLDGAVEAGVAHLAAAGVERAVVAHSDLPLATGLAELAAVDGVLLVPDRHHDGTNVIALPTAAAFRFSYGPGSCAKHRAEAVRCGLPVEVRPDAGLGWDVDLPADLAPPGGLPRGLLPDRPIAVVSGMAR